MKIFILFILLNFNLLAYEEWLLLGTSETFKIDYSDKNIKEVWSYDCYDYLCWIKNPIEIKAGFGYWLKIENYQEKIL